MANQEKINQRDRKKRIKDATEKNSETMRKGKLDVLRVWSPLAQKGEKIRYVKKRCIEEREAARIIRSHL